MPEHSQQAIVIGLGQFGTSVAHALSDRGVEVLAIDTIEERVQSIAPHVAEAMCLDATDLDSLQRVSPGERDVCVCAIGDDDKEASIICTALLRQIGGKRIIARANDEVHARILRLVGAHQVVNPEREFGERFASQIVHDRIKGEMQLGAGVLLSEVVTPETFVGQPLASLRLPARFGVTVVAVRRAKDGSVVLPDADTTPVSGDVIVLVAREGAVSKMLEKA